MVLKAKNERIVCSFESIRSNGLQHFFSRQLSKHKHQKLEKLNIRIFLYFQIWRESENCGIGRRNES